MYHKWWSYEVWFLRYRAQQTEFFVISGYFLPFHPSYNPENQNFEKMKKTRGIIILNTSTKNNNHMMYDSWDTDHNRPSFLSWKIKISKKKKRKKRLEILPFYTSVPKIMIICYTVPEIWQVTHVIVIFHFGLFVALLSPLIAQKIKNPQKWKKHLERSSFYTCTKIMTRCCTVPEIWCAMDGRTDIRTDGRTAKVTYRGGCPT